MEVDTVNNIAPTILTGNFTIQVKNTDKAKLTIEGIYNNNVIRIADTLTNATFLKSRFLEIDNTSDVSGYANNLMIIHCKVTNRLRLLGGSSVSMINSYLEDVGSFRDVTAYFQFENCVLNWTYTRLYEINSNYYEQISNIKNSTFKNCIILRTGDTYVLSIPSTSSAYNSISFYKTFDNIPNTTNSVVSGWSSIFKTYDGNYNDLESWELTDDAKTKYKGTDGTEVGIHGGSLPFSPTPSNPQITKCNVAAKSTADGKLSVDIEVAGAE